MLNLVQGSKVLGSRVRGASCALRGLQFGILDYSKDSDPHFLSRNPQRATRNGHLKLYKLIEPTFLQEIDNVLTGNLGSPPVIFQILFDSLSDLLMRWRIIYVFYDLIGNFAPVFGYLQ